MNLPAKKKQILTLGLVLMILYPALYCGLRLSKYFVRQKFVTFTAPEHVWEKYPNDDGPVVEGYTSYQFESERNQIGCGRIQKPTQRFGENILLPIFRPLGEAEMRIRGFTNSDIRVLEYVASFERSLDGGHEVYFHRETLVDEVTVSRQDQIQKRTFKQRP